MFSKPRIRTADPKKDFEALYALGLATPEFKVGASGEFMDREEFESALKNPNGTFLLAEIDDVVVGFVYANRKDVERGPQTKWACLVYIVVDPDYRKQGLAQSLYDHCIQDLKKYGVNRLYAWANSEGDGSIIKLLQKNGLEKGHAYVWMDKEI